MYCWYYSWYSVDSLIWYCIHSISHVYFMMQWLSLIFSQYLIFIAGNVVINPLFYILWLLLFVSSYWWYDHSIYFCWYCWNSWHCVFSMIHSVMIVFNIQMLAILMAYSVCDNNINVLYYYSNGYVVHCCLIMTNAIVDDDTIQWWTIDDDDNRGNWPMSMLFNVDYCCYCGLWYSVNDCCDCWPSVYWPILLVRWCYYSLFVDIV